MLKKLDAGPHAQHVFAEPTPLGLIGLSIGCAALTPIAFGYSLTPAGFKTAAIYCLLFGAGCQFLAGMMNFANKNVWGGTLLTAFSFNWLFNWWVLDEAAQGRVADHGIVLAVEALFLVIFLVFTYGFGFFSKLLFAFLLDIDLLFVAKLVKATTGTRAMDIPVAVFTIGLAAIALWISFATMLNPTAGRPLFKIPGPMFLAVAKPSFDFSLRRAIFDVLYAQFREKAFEPLPFAELEKRVKEKAGERAVAPDLFYLSERGGIALTLRGGRVEDARLTADGIDAYEQDVLAKNAAA